ncbi:MAG: M1 family aminopeptidase [Pyrinomonadaceae bacterium]
MKTTRVIPSLLSAVILAIAAFSASAQVKRADFNRPQTVDIQHYVIRASFDRAKKTVNGDTTVSFKPLKADLRSVELDAVDLKFTSVTLEPSGIDLSYKAANGKVTITLDKTYGAEETVAVRLKYSAEPKKGVYFVDASSSADGVKHSAQIWTQGEAEEARHWFPSYDFPSDKATTEQYITAQSKETVIGNGEFLGKADNGDGTATWHYKMPVPHSTYLVSFVIGEYVKVEDKYKDIPLGFYVYPGKEVTAQKAFGDTKKMIAVYEELTGVSFPYNKYDQTIVAQFQFGGMENITATTMADTEIFFAEFDFGKMTVMDLVSHELAHSWFGDLVTCRNWAELWLNEGFATFMEAAYREKQFGRADYMRKIRSDAAAFLIDDTINRRRHALYNQRAADVDSLFDNAATTYNKGGAVVHTLREQVGTDNFWKAINIYLNRHKFGPVESTDLRKAMEEVSGQDLAWFFDQWVYGAGAPSLSVKQAYSARSKTYTLTFSQTQLTDTLTPSTFRLPMSITYKVGAKTVEQAVDITKRIQTVSFKVDGRPSSLAIDPQERIPLKKVKLKPMSVGN